MERCYGIIQHLGKRKGNEISFFISCRVLQSGVRDKMPIQKLYSCCSNSMAPFVSKFSFLRFPTLGVFVHKWTITWWRSMGRQWWNRFCYDQLIFETQAYQRVIIIPNSVHVHINVILPLKQNTIKR